MLSWVLTLWLAGVPLLVQLCMCRKNPQFFISHEWQKKILQGCAPASARRRLPATRLELWELWGIMGNYGNYGELW